MAEIITLTGKYKDINELATFCNLQYQTIQLAAKKIEELETEIARLQGLVAASTPLVGNSSVATVIKSPELVLCEAQIQLLQNRNLTKELTLEETKKLDLLIKNKRMLSADTKTLEGKKKQPVVEYDEAELVEVARIEEKKPE